MKTVKAVFDRFYPKLLLLC